MYTHVSAIYFPRWLCCFCCYCAYLECAYIVFKIPCEHFLSFFPWSALLLAGWLLLATYRRNTSRRTSPPATFSFLSLSSPLHIRCNVQWFFLQVTEAYSWIFTAFVRRYCWRRPLYENVPKYVYFIRIHNVSAHNKQPKYIIIICWRWSRERKWYFGICAREHTKTVRIAWNVYVYRAVVHISSEEIVALAVTFARIPCHLPVDWMLFIMSCL